MAGIPFRAVCKSQSEGEFSQGERVGRELFRIQPESNLKTCLDSAEEDVCVF